MRITSQLFLVLILLLPSSFSFTKYSKKEKYPIVTMGIKMPFGLQAGHSTDTNLNFLDISSGAHIGVGLTTEIVLFRYLALEAGAFYRYSFYGEKNVSIKEFHFPLLLKFRFPITPNKIFLIGGGTSYFHEISGEIDPSDTVNPSFGQRSISLPEQDLRNGFSFILKMELQWGFTHEVFINYEMSYERSKKALNIISDNFTFTLGVNFRVF